LSVGPHQYVLTGAEEQIRRLQQKSSIEHEFSVFTVPRRTLVCGKIFEDAGVLGDVSVEEFPLYFLPLDEDLLSLELEDSFGDLHLVRAPLAAVPRAVLLTFLSARIRRASSRLLAPSC
jgi:vacuolar protein sorting-associated protein 33A